MIKNEVCFLMFIFLSFLNKVERVESTLNSRANFKNFISMINKENLEKKNKSDDIFIGNSKSDEKKQKLQDKMLNFNFLTNLNDSDFSNKIKDYNKKLSIYGGIEESEFDRENEVENELNNEDKNEEALITNSNNINDENNDDILFSQLSEKQVANKSGYDLLKESVKVLIEQVIDLNTKLSKVGTSVIVNQIIDMPKKGQESKTKHGLIFDDIININVSITNGSKNNKILRSQNNLIDQKLLFNWYVDKDNFYLLYPSNIDKKNELFLNNAKVNVSYIVKNK